MEDGFSNPEDLHAKDAEHARALATEAGLSDAEIAAIVKAVLHFGPLAYSGVVALFKHRPHSA